MILAHWSTLFITIAGGSSEWSLPNSLTVPSVAATTQAGAHAPFVHFGGDGGPGGAFDWEIGSSGGGAIQTQTVDTAFTVIFDSTHTASQTVIQGNIEVRNLTVWPNGKLIFQGPFPCTIHASGTVRIEGKVILKGVSNRGVTSFNTAHIPELGGAGTAGGGNGGVGSPLTTQSDAQGGPGFGAFNSVAGGGGGGETGYSDGGVNSRRPGGGGGGAFRADVLRPSPNPNGCPDQIVIGLDAERGFNGSIASGGFVNSGAISGLFQQPQGGSVGPRPFVDLNRSNDFWGAMITQHGVHILGELLTPWAGAGGGGGGDSVKSATFPQVPFSVLLNQKGAGGGGGGGCLVVFARGDIVLSGFGSIDASGGTGGGGENTNGVDRVGGGSGGGSGGHIILQSASKIDLSQVTANAPYPSESAGGLYAVGGQGGEGAGGNGGAQANGIPTTPMKDALPPNSYPSSGPSAGPCAFAGNMVGDPGQNAGPIDVVYDCGGDGGPGLIQLHVRSLDDILPPVTAGVDLRLVVRPPPVGATPDNVDDPHSWNRLRLQAGMSPKRD